MRSRFFSSRKALWLWLLAMLACAWVLAHSRFTADMSAFLPRSPSAQQQLLVDQISSGSVSRMVLVGIEGGNAAQRSAASQAMRAELRSNASFALVANGEAASFERDQQFLFAHRYALSAQVDAQRFSAQGLHQAIGASINALASPAGLMLKPLFARDPTGEMLDIINAVDVDALPSGSEVWTSRDASRAILMLQTRASGADTDAQEAALQAIRSAFARAQTQTQEQTQASPMRLLMAGTPVFSVNARQTIRSQATYLSTLGFLAVLSVLLLVYRRPLTVGLSLLPVLSAVAAGITAISLVFGVVHGVTVGFGSTLVGEAVDYSIYYFVQSGAQHSRGPWVQRFWPTIRLGMLTSVFGFATLMLSGFPGLAQLGLYSIVGLCVAALVTRHVLPLLPAAHIDSERSRRAGLWMAAQTQRAQRLRTALWLLAAAACLVVGHFAWHGAVWNRSLSALSPVPAQDIALAQSLRADLGQGELRYIVVTTAPTQQEALQNAERLAPALQALVREGVIAGFASPAQYLPSLATQAARRAALPEAGALQKSLATAVQGLPVDAHTLQAFVDDVQQARELPPIGLQSLQGTALALSAEAMLVPRHGQYSALLPLRAPNDAQGQPQEDIDTAAVQRALRSASAVQATFLDVDGETHQLYARYFNEALQLALAGMIAIVLLLAAALRNARRLLRVLLPIAVAQVLVVALLLLCGVQLTLMHLIGLLLVVAVGSNYTLFFERYRLQDPEQASTLSSLLVANIATVCGFGVLAFSSVPVLRAVGATVGPGAMLALLAAAILVRHDNSANA